MFGVWGLLPLAIVLLVWAAGAATLLVFHDEKSTPADRAAGFVVLAMAIVHLSVGGLGELGLLSAGALLAVLGASSALFTAALPQRGGPVCSPRLTRADVVALVPTLTILGLSVVTARITPIWQWDAFGYHLPFVHFVLQSGGFDGVPRDVPYISTYPHNVELEMVWLRAMLPDDRLVDLVQVPLGAAGALLIAAIARRLGAPRAWALLGGAAWLGAPGVFLQLPTNYVDVGAATALLGAVYFALLSEPTRRNLALGGVALGLFLGCKPSAPVVVALALAFVTVRALRAKQHVGLAGLWAGTLVFGAQVYVDLWLRHGNPVWPVSVKLGPWALPGERSVEKLLAAAAAVPGAGAGNALERVTLSWLAVDASPVFDMRLGGFGGLFLLALPFALVTLVRARRAALLAAVALAALAPDPANTRYVLGLAGLVFALAAVQARALRRHEALAPSLIVVAVIAAQVARAFPGLTGEGPSWVSLWQMSDAERRIAVGPEGPPRQFAPLWAELSARDRVAFDGEFELPGLLWSPSLDYSVQFLPRLETAAELQAWLTGHDVTVVAVGSRHAELLRRLPGGWRKRFDCTSSECAVYLRGDRRAER
ncbi:MAG: hypothetical protein JNK82_32575 [Myxococcaceae bacterium]|nr:hypothetical protein [Myxococcaceae bacterium]